MFNYPVYLNPDQLEILYKNNIDILILVFAIGLILFNIIKIKVNK